MIRRTKGRFLITLLVVTGLAGTLDNSSVTQRERKYALTLLKDGRTEMLAEVKGLSEKQLNYKAPGSPLSIKECLLRMAFTEKELWQTITASLKESANPEQRSSVKYTDAELISMTKTGALTTSNTFKRANAPWKNVTAAVTGFKNMRSEHIKYMKTSTEDLRNHVVQTPAGWIDCYQYILVMSAETNKYIQQIRELKQGRSFPRN